MECKQLHFEQNNNLNEQVFHNKGLCLQSQQQQFSFYSMEKQRHTYFTIWVGAIELSQVLKFPTPL